MAFASSLLLQRYTAIPTTPVASKLFPFPFSSKSNAAVSMQIRRKPLIVSASKPSGGNSTEKKSDDAPQGPPLPTILAGFVLLFLVFLIAQSIITGLIGFLVSLIPFK